MGNRRPPYLALFPTTEGHYTGAAQASANSYTSLDMNIWPPMSRTNRYQPIFDGGSNETIFFPKPWISFSINTMMNVLLLLSKITNQSNGKVFFLTPKGLGFVSYQRQDYIL